MKYTILLYYKYATIPNPELVRDRQRALCEKLGLKGRIIVAKEGVNATLEGTTANIEAYCDELTSKRPFKNIHLKKSEGTGNAFPKLSVKVRNEIVSLGLGEKDINPNKVTGKYLTPTRLYNWLRKKKDIHIVDMRNDYEQRVGKFENSILPGMENFRDLPKVLPQLKNLKDKTVVTVCTGGVRCEKASGFLCEQGFEDVYQLKGGIVSYMEKYVGQDFKGKLYVFDGRVTMGFQKPEDNPEVIGTCDRCGKLSEDYVNCANAKCHIHFICCKSCRTDNGDGYCAKCDPRNA
jgi:UPF0176 protein